MKITDNVKPPIYAEQEMMIGAWIEPIHTLDDYKFAKDMGLTHMLVGDNCFGVERGTEAFAAILNTCAEAGLNVIVRTMNQYPFTDNTDYSAFQSVSGINYWDEPFDKDFSNLAEIADFHEAKYGGKLLYYVNLTGNVVSPGWHPWSEDKTYAQYVDEFCDVVLGKIEKGVKMVSSDVYPFVVKGGTGERIIKTSWLPCVETIAHAAKKIGADSCFFIQSSSFKAGADYYPQPSWADISLQIYTEMAFGIRNFIYFTYADYGQDVPNKFWTKALVRNTESCTAHDAYHWAKTVNTHIKAMQNAYLSFQWLGTMPVVGSENKSGKSAHFDNLEQSFDSIECVSSCSATQDTLIGAFKDAQQRDGLFVTNFSDPSIGAHDIVKLVLEDAKHVAVYASGQRTVYELDNHALELNLESGGAAFVVLLADEMIASEG